MSLATGQELSRYFLASLLALAVDTGFLLLMAGWMHYALAASMSFFLGAVVHYLLSVAFVFHKRRLASRKIIEVVVFVATGVGGLLVNVGVISVCIECFYSSLFVAKLVAAGASFVFGYGARKLILF